MFCGCKLEHRNRYLVRGVAFLYLLQVFSFKQSTNLQNANKL